MNTRPSGYAVFLHLALVGLCCLTVVLAIENRKLKSTSEQTPVGPAIGQNVIDVRWRSIDENGAIEAATDQLPDTHDSLLFIFTTDCPACRRTQSAWRSIHQSLGNRVNVVGISLSDIEATRSYRESLALPFPVGIPTNPPKFIESFSISSVPLTVRINPEGRVTGVWSGTLSAHQLSEIAEPLA